MHTNVPVLKVFDVVPAGGSRGRRKKRVGNLFPLILRPQILRRELMPCRDRRRIPNARKYTDLAETCGSAHLGANIFPEYLAGSLKIQGCPYLTTATLYLLTETSDRLMTYRVGSISPSKFLPWKSTRHASAQIVEIYIQQKKSIVKTQRFRLVMLFLIQGGQIKTDQGDRMRILLLYGAVLRRRRCSQQLGIASKIAAFTPLKILTKFKRYLFTTKKSLFGAALVRKRLLGCFSSKMKMVKLLPSIRSVIAI
ncbi:uncharacterized protein LOC128861034 isoform X2 [Anastrepha ludens]|uniref:uncharacterized protein LOC128861034 isoform X2 n=1 Tax=Anastrepha ludens TaxID=28586 RepID=UPI0023B171F4|nr:uncharacterized protein LOC128861034 isoform X2 [Anastrepha ludens]